MKSVSQYICVYAGSQKLYLRVLLNLGHITANQQGPKLWQILTRNSLRVDIAAAADRDNLETEKLLMKA